ncbi:MAG: hypothetical protein Q8T11_12035 [Elusimicrobiota bacterium]|nr:hypothetical protein [Elusimicrobiota bacterium]
MNLPFGLSAASWVCFAVSAFSLHTPSPLLLATVPAHFVLALAAFFPAGAKRSVLAVNAVLMSVSFFWMFRQTFLGGRA